MDMVASRTHFEMGGVRESHALEDVGFDPDLPLSGAIMFKIALLRRRR